MLLCFQIDCACRELSEKFRWLKDVNVEWTLPKHDRQEGKLEDLFIDLQNRRYIFTAVAKK